MFCSDCPDLSDHAVFSQGDFCTASSVLSSFWFLIVPNEPENVCLSPDCCSCIAMMINASMQRPASLLMQKLLYKSVQLWLCGEVYYCRSRWQSMQFIEQMSSPEDALMICQWQNADCRFLPGLIKWRFCCDNIVRRLKEAFQSLKHLDMHVCQVSVIHWLSLYLSIVSKYSDFTACCVLEGIHLYILYGVLHSDDSSSLLLLHRNQAGKPV